MSLHHACAVYNSGFNYIWWNILEIVWQNDPWSILDIVPENELGINLGNTLQNPSMRSRDRTSIP